MNANHLVSTKRYEHIDALRGWALLGIFLMNIEFYQGAFLDTSFGIHKYTNNLDIFLSYFVKVFIQGSFWVIFSFLFGVSLVLSSKRHNAKWQYNRLMILLLFGLLHFTLVWDGDILTLYALSGIIVWSFINKDILPILTLAIVMIFLSFLVGYSPILWIVFLLFVLLINYQVNKDKNNWSYFGLFSFLITPLLLMILIFLEPSSNNKVEYENANAIINFYNDLISSDYISSIKARSLLLLEGILDNQYLLLSVLGIIMLGVWFANNELYKDIDESLNIWRRWIFYGAIIGLAFNILPIFFHIYTPDNHHWSKTIFPPLMEIGDLFFGFCIMGLFFLLFNNNKVKVFLSSTIPAGKMALSNYLLQNIIGVILFAPFTLDLSMPYRIKILFAISFFILQIYLSKWFLSKYRQGPFEYVWRKLTDLDEKVKIN